MYFPAMQWKPPRDIGRMSVGPPGFEHSLGGVFKTGPETARIQEEESPSQPLSDSSVKKYLMAIPTRQEMENLF